MSKMLSNAVYEDFLLSRVAAARGWMEIGMGRSLGFNAIDMLGVLSDIEGLGMLHRSVDYPESKWTRDYDRSGIMVHIKHHCELDRSLKFSNFEFYIVGNFLLEMSGKSYFDAQGLVERRNA